MQTVRNINRLGKGDPTIAIHGVTFELNRALPTPRYEARVDDDTFSAFLASTGRNEPAPAKPLASLGIALTDNPAIADVSAFRNPDNWVLSITRQRVDVLESVFSVPFEHGKADLPEFAG